MQIIRDHVIIGEADGFRAKNIVGNISKGKASVLEGKDTVIISYKSVYFDNYGKAEKKYVNSYELDKVLYNKIKNELK